MSDRLLFWYYYQLIKPTQPGHPFWVGAVSTADDHDHWRNSELYDLAVWPCYRNCWYTTMWAPFWWFLAGVYLSTCLSQAYFTFYYKFESREPA